MYSVAILNGSFGFFSYNNDFLQKYPTTSLCMYYTQLSPLLLTLRCAIVWEYNRALTSKTDQTQTTPTLLKSNTKKSWVFFLKLRTETKTNVALAHLLRNHSTSHLAARTYHKQGYSLDHLTCRTPATGHQVPETIRRVEGICLWEQKCHQK